MNLISSRLPWLSEGYRISRFAPCLFLAALLPGVLTAQESGKHTALMTLWKAGHFEELRRELQSIPEKDKEDPGLLFLRGVSEADGDKAITYFQAIVNLHPESEWADDALYRLYQYSYAIGAYNTADKHLSRLKTSYPASPYPGREADITREPEIPASGGYSVQVAAFTRKEDAEDYRDEMKKFGYSAELNSKQVGGKNLVAVWIGIFPDKESAAAFARKMKSRHKIDALVVRR